MNPVNHQNIYIFTNTFADICMHTYTYTHKYINNNKCKYVVITPNQSPSSFLCLAKNIFLYRFLNRIMLGYFFSSALSLFHSFTPQTETQKLFKVVRTQRCFKYSYVFMYVLSSPSNSTLHLFGETVFWRSYFQVVKCLLL